MFINNISNQVHTKCHLYTAYSLAILFVLIVSKVALLIAYEEPFWYVLWFVGEETILAAILGFFSIWRIRLSYFFVFLIVLLNVINLHYFKLYGQFVSLAEFEWLTEFSHLQTSLYSILDFNIIIFSLALFVLYAFVLRLLVHYLSFLSCQFCLISFFLLSTVLIGMYFTPQNIIKNKLQASPLRALIYSTVKSKPVSENKFSQLQNKFNINSKFFMGKTFNPVINHQSKKKFNVIILVLESIGMTSLKSQGELSITLPNIMKLKEHGVWWDNFYVNVPSSYKTFFSLHTGLYPIATRRSIGELYPRIKVDTLAEIFKRNQYRTALLHSADFGFRRQDAFIRDRGYDVLKDINSIPYDKSIQHSSWGVDDRAIFDYGKSWIKSAESPFLLTLIPADTHHPYTIRKNIKKVFEGDLDIVRYQNLTYYNDKLIGDLVSFLKQNNLYKDTIIITMSDHGEAFGQHKGNYLHSNALYQENVHIPFMISNPRLFPSPQNAKNFATVTDLLPTLIDLLALSEVEHLPMDGESLFKTKQNRIAYFYTGQGGTKLGLRDGHLKYIYNEETQVSELYDLDNDPDEKINIAKDYPDYINYYRQQVQNWHQYTIHAIHHIADQGAFKAESGKIIKLTEINPSFISQDYGDLSYDRNLNGRLFNVAGKEYPTYGFGTHANSIIQFDVSNYKHATLSTKVGRIFHDKKFQERFIQAQIWLDGKKIYQSSLLDSKTKPETILLPIKGKTLALIIEQTDDGKEGDHAVWLEPHLIMQDKK